MAIQQFRVGQRDTPAVEGKRRNNLNTAKLNTWFALGLFLLIIATGVSAFVDKQTHIVCGLAMLVAVLIHLALHWRWITSVVGRLHKVVGTVRAKLLVDVLMLLTFILLTLSGAIVTLIYAPAVAHFHTVMFYLFIGMIALHLTLNAKWIIGKLTRR